MSRRGRFSNPCRGKVEQVPGHTLAHRGEGTTRDLVDEAERPFTQLGEERSCNPQVAGTHDSGDGRGDAEYFGVHKRLSGGRHREAGREEGQDPDQCARAAVPNGHRAAVRRSHEHPDHTGDDQFQVRVGLAFPVRHRPRRHPHPGGPHQQGVEHLARQLTQVRRRDCGAQISIHWQSARHGPHRGPGLQPPTRPLSVLP
jgi:hypothetical protein